MRWAAGAAAAVVISTMTTAPALAASPGVAGDPGGITVVATGLEGPREISDRDGGSIFVVAEADAGRVSTVNPRNGRVTPVLTGLGEGLVQGVDRARGITFVAIGSPAPEDEGAPPPAPYGTSVLLGSRGGSTPVTFSDLGAFELDNNPDAQPQFGADGRPLDALSNPYYVRAHRDGSALIADAGGNDVLFRTTTGELKLWRALPLITGGACDEVPNNDPTVFGCDPVPTGIAYGNRDDVYVSALGSLVPGGGRVFVYDWARQKPIRTIDGLSGATGVAVDKDGNVYVSELLEGAPDTENIPPGFDPATVGQIVKIAPDGSRSYAQVTMPSGLLFHRGALYASAWSIAGDLGIPSAGQIVRVDDAAFVPGS